MTVYTKNLRLKRIPSGSDSWADDAWSNYVQIDKVGNAVTPPSEAGDKTTVNAYSRERVKIPSLTLRPREDGTVFIELGRAGDTVIIKGQEYGTSTSSANVSAWSSSTQYSVGALIYNYGLLFKCEVAHTSSPSFSTDLEFWVCLSQGAGILPMPAGENFQKFDVIRHNGSDWTLAIANSFITLSDPPTIVVTSSTSYFLYTMNGILKIDNTLTTSEFYFLSDSVAGGLTTSEPTDYSNPILKCLSNEAVMILPYRPMGVL